MLLDAPVIANVPVARDYLRITLEAPDVAAAAHPGQFLMMTIARDEELAPVLPRPMAIYGVDTAAGTVDVVYRTVGTGTIPRFTPVRFSITDAGLTCGEDAGSAVTRRYRAPFRFTGKLRRVVVHVAGPGVVDPDAVVDAKLRTQ